MVQERRTSPRIPVDIGIKRKGSRFFVKYSGDISTNGVFLNTAVPLPIGEKVEIEVILNPDEKLILKGEVLAQRPEEINLGVSILFSDLTQKEKRQIEEYIQSAVYVNG